jgi:hypothetical protein
MGSKPGSKLKNRAISNKLTYSFSSLDEVRTTGNDEATYEWNRHNDREYQHFLSSINEAKTNSKPRDTPKFGQRDDKDSNEKESCQGQHQLELLDDEELLPAQQPSPPSDTLPQPLIAELSSLEECMLPTNVRQNDGQDDQESHNETINKTTVDANGYWGDTPKCG